MSLLSTLRREFDLFMGFTWRDWSASIITCGIFAVGSIKDLPYHVAICNYLQVVLWATLYEYSFNLFTQSMSLDEDRINKPDRPIPSGKISVHAAMKRCMIVWAAFLAMAAYHRHIMAETITWILVTIFLGATKAGGHWLGKNSIGMSTGCWSLLSSGRKLMGPPTAETAQHLLALEFWAVFSVHSQDFRDQAGDRKMGRRTLPLAFGDHAARYIYACILAPLCFLGPYFLNLGKNAPWLLAAMHATVAYRFLKYRNVRSDHKTYMLVTYIFCVLAAVSSLKGLGMISPTAPLKMGILRWSEVLEIMERHLAVLAS